MSPTQSRRCPRRMRAALVALVVGLLAGCQFTPGHHPAPRPDPSGPAGPTAAASPTAQPTTAPSDPAGPADPTVRPTPPVDASSHILTWGHPTAVATDQGGLSDDQVRQSPYYAVSVAPVNDPTQTENSFTYMSVPRNGEVKRGYDGEDGADFAAQAGSSMSWSSFGYDVDVDVDVSLTTGQTISSVDQVTIRPLSLGLTATLVDDHTVRVRVPASDSGYRFSVDFAPQTMDVYVTSSGGLTETAQGNALLESEPRNSLVVFAQPPAPEGTVPTPDDGTIEYVTPETVHDLDSTTAEVLYFTPGVYAMGSDYRAMLPTNVRWVYLAPGAYVKGAFRFADSDNPDYRVTGYGVLSGEQYVYEADTLNGYQRKDAASANCHATCVKMLQFGSADAEQHLTLQGVTIKEPPYHSFVVYGDEDTFHMDVSNYQQVGAWYWQTDGLELYSGSTMRDTFFHSNDDVLKLYHSDVTVADTVVWKNQNGPVVQWGWSPRSIEGVSVTDTTVIHNRMHSGGVGTNTCVFNASPHWDSAQFADSATTVRDMTFTNTRVEGRVNCALRIWALSNTESVSIDGLYIDAWGEQSAALQQSVLETLPDETGTHVTIGNQVSLGQGLSLHNYTVGGTPVFKAGDNWAMNELGRLNFNGALWESWDATADSQPQGRAPSLTVEGPDDGATLDSRTLTLSGRTDAARLVLTVNGVEQDVPVDAGSYSVATQLGQVRNTVRLAAYSASGVATVERYTFDAFGSRLGSLSDPQGDDHGPGSYTYPTDGAFTPGSFDLTGMNVYTDGEKVRFVTTLASDIANPWGAHGMSTQRLNIYLRDAKRTDVAPTALLEGTNTWAQGAWDLAIVGDGRNEGGELGPGLYDASSTRLGDVDLQVHGSRIVLSVDASLLGGLDPAAAGYEVSLYSSAEAGESVGHVRPVLSADCTSGVTCESWVGRYRLGGGVGTLLPTLPFDSDRTDSNAMDMMTGNRPQSQVMALGQEQVVAPYLVLEPPHATGKS